MRHVGYSLNDELSELMNGFIRNKLEMIPDNVTWGGKCPKDTFSPKFSWFQSLDDVSCPYAFYVALCTYMIRFRSNG